MREKAAILFRRKPLALRIVERTVMRGLRRRMPSGTRFQNAQSMVEFALTLPILLLVIFGIIGFGHLFFSYSLVVNASREAARYGSTVGLTDRSVPRYRDCNEIRENAVRVGGIAGVAYNETSVIVQYDKGPKENPAEEPDLHPHGCPIDGYGPGYVGLGDRIVVTVTVNYQPIVPLVNIPSFPITAVTRRTIVLGMPVGDVPVAESLCSGTITRVIPPTWDKGFSGSFSRSGETIHFDLEVIADNPSVSAPGMLYLFVDKLDYEPINADCSGPAPYLNCATLANFTWTEIEQHMVRARYIPDPPLTTGDPCYRPSLAEPVVHWVLPADTVTTILSHDPEPSDQEQTVLVEVQVVPVAPGGGTPEGPVYVYEEDDMDNFCVVTLEPVIDTPGIAVGNCEIALTQEGYNGIVAVYDPFDAVPYFNTSTVREPHTVGEKIEPTWTLIPTPTPTVFPSDCPVFEPFMDGIYAGKVIDFSQNPRGLSLNVRNDGYLPGKITSIEIGWPDMDPLASLTTVYLGAGQLWSSGVTGYGPPTQLLTPTSPNWDPAAAVLSPEMQTPMLVDFSYDLITGQTYSVTINFDNSDPNFDCRAIIASGVR